MAYDLKITFGGLCMFVQKEDEPKGLYVLMPKMDMPRMKHCRMMITHPANSGEPADRLVPLKSFEDLTCLADAGNKASMPKMVLEISKYAEMAVNPKCFTAAPPDCLAWRIALPLGSKMTPSPTLGKLDVPDGAGGYVRGEFTGMVDVVTRVTKRNDLTIAGKTLTPSGGEIAIKLLNVPRAELEGVRLGSKIGQFVDHADAYYAMLGDYCLTGLAGPPIKHAERHASKAGKPSGKGCPIIDDDVPKGAFEPHTKGDPKPHIDGVDPNNCTIASGCASYPCP